MQRFKGQVAIVTGGARGIGEGIGLRLAEEACKVYLIDKLELVFETMEQMQKRGLDVQAFQMDITDEQKVKSVIDQIIRDENHLDVLVNCAGIAGPTSTKITDYDLEDFERVLSINLTGSFIMTKYVIPPMLKQKYGRILHIASMGGKEGNPGMVGYAASKSGLMGLVKGVGKEYAGSGITVNGLAPAVIETPMNLDTDPEMMKYMVAKIPMGRLGTVEEVAAISCWIASKEASFNTGFIFDISGGRATY